MGMHEKTAMALIGARATRSRIVHRSPSGAP
jgi:hypothetical protein